MLRNNSGGFSAGNYEFLGFGGAYGMFQDPDTGLVYCRARWYDPTTKQFLTPAPLSVRGSGQMNLYGYAGNNPLNASDPNGLDIISNVFHGSAQVAWFVQSPTVSADGVNWQTSSARTSATIPLGIASDGVALDPRFGGGFATMGELNAAAASVFEENRDLSGKTRAEQERAIASLIQQHRQGRPTRWAVGRVQEVMSAAPQQAQAARGAERAAVLKQVRELGFESIEEYVRHAQAVEQVRAEFLEMGWWDAMKLKVQVGALNIVDAFTPDWTDFGKSIARDRDLLGGGTGVDDTLAGSASRVLAAGGRELLITAATLGLGSGLQGARAIQGAHAARIATSTTRAGAFFNLSRSGLSQGVMQLALSSNSARLGLQAANWGLRGYEGYRAYESGVDSYNAFSEGHNWAGAGHAGRAALGVLGFAGGGYGGIRRTIGWEGTEAFLRGGARGGLQRNTLAWINKGARYDKYYWELDELQQALYNRGQKSFMSHFWKPREELLESFTRGLGGRERVLGIVERGEYLKLHHPIASSQLNPWHAWAIFRTLSTGPTPSARVFILRFLGIQ